MAQPLPSSWMGSAFWGTPRRLAAPAWALLTGAWSWHSPLPVGDHSSPGHARPHLPSWALELSSCLPCLILQPRSAVLGLSFLLRKRQEVRSGFPQLSSPRPVSLKAQGGLRTLNVTCALLLGVLKQQVPQRQFPGCCLEKPPLFSCKGCWCQVCPWQPHVIQTLRAFCSCDRLNNLFTRSIPTAFPIHSLLISVCAQSGAGAAGVRNRAPPPCCEGGRRAALSLGTGGLGDDGGTSATICQDALCGSCHQGWLSGG